MGSNEPLGQPITPNTIDVDIDAPPVHPQAKDESPEDQGKKEGERCRCFVSRPVNLAPHCSSESMVALRTQGIIPVQDEALRPVPKIAITCSSVQVL